MTKGWKPSTSLSAEMASSTVVSSMCGGRGSCTRMPCTAASALSPRITSNTSSALACSGNACLNDWIAQSPHALILFRTYVSLSGRDPTMTTASPGWTPYLLAISSADRFTSALTVDAMALPSISFSLNCILASSTAAAAPAPASDACNVTLPDRIPPPPPPLTAESGGVHALPTRGDGHAL